jgi:hypothetical protein
MKSIAKRERKSANTEGGLDGAGLLSTSTNVLKSASTKGRRRKA